MSFLTGASSVKPIQYTPSGISNPTGLNIQGAGYGAGTVTESPTLASNVGSLQSTFANAANATSNLAQTVAPGFSQFRQAGLRDITNTFRANRSNLQDTLSQRRILGSSFANSQFSQQAADEAQTKANFEATSYLQETAAFNQLMQEQYQYSTQQFSSAISQSNIESNMAASLISNNNQIAGQIATANAKLQSEANAGAGSFLGTLLGTGVNALGGKGLFSSGGIFGGSGGGSIGTDATIFGSDTSAFLGDVGSYLGDAAAVAAV